MNKIIILLMLFPITGLTGEKSNIEILEYLDYSNDKYSIQMLISILKKSDLTEQNFELKDNGDSKTVLSFLDKRQKGQKILTTNKGMWFISNKTRRAIRIPAIQKLFGDASVGDVSRLSYSRDYSLVDSEFESNSVLYLKLKSKSLAATYHLVDLYVDRLTYFPVRANFYAASGKHLKSVNYVEVGLYHDKPFPTHWRITTVGTGKSTEIKINQINEIETHPREFTKKYLQLVK